MDEFTRPHLERSALLTIDLQRDFLSGSPYGIAGTTEVLPAVRRLVRTYRAAFRPVRLYLPDGSNAELCRRALLAGGAALALPGSVGSQLAPALAAEHPIELDHKLLLSGGVQRLGKVEYALFKPRWNAFHRTSLGDHLQRVGVDTVVVTGCNFPNCPRATLFGASERDYRAVLATDAVSQFHPHARAELHNLGIVTLTTGEILAQLTATFPTSSPHGRSVECAGVDWGDIERPGDHQCMNGRLAEAIAMPSSGKRSKRQVPEASQLCRTANSPGRSISSRTTKALAVSALSKNGRAGPRDMLRPSPAGGPSTSNRSCS